MDNQLTPFEGKNIRRVEHNGDIYLSVVDIIEALTDSPNPIRYWTDLKRRSKKETGQLYAFCVKLKFLAPDGKMRPTECADTEGVLRIVQSVPSPKAEPFRMWLAKVGRQMIDETVNPELGLERLREIYLAKGYDEKWIENRLKGISIRKELTDEWQKRGVKEGQEFSMLTATIAKGTFGLTPKEHAQHKGLEKENLRDHMTNLELLFTAIGEEVTRSMAVEADAQGYLDNYAIAQKGGESTGKARRQLEESSGQKVVSNQNFLSLKEDSASTDSLPQNTEGGKID
jgi:DNA-damage-inducible protein D